MSRKPLIAANWKMNPPPEGFDAKDSPYQPREDVDVVVFPTFVDLAKCIGAELATGAQYARPEAIGAFTGDISMPMVHALGCTHVMCGHSDRRQFHGETDSFIADQVKAAIDVGLHPILCIGETLDERNDGKGKEVVKRQLETVLQKVGISLSTDHCPLTVAYEPVWAISRGDPNTPAATTKDAQDMHAFIRSLLPSGIRDAVHILYGGSMKGSNAKDLLSQPDIDGGLVGGASLKPEEFRGIVEAAIKIEN